MTELNTPDILGQYNQGFATGRGQLAGKLAGQAYSATGDQQKSLLGQLTGVDPRLGMSMAGQIQDQQAQHQQMQQAQQVDHAKKINGAANFVLQAVQTKDPAKIQGAYQAVRPYLSEITGKEAPAQWDDSMLPGLYQTLAATGGAPQQKGTVVAPGGALVDSSTGQQMFANPAAQQYHDVPMGEGHAAGVFDPATGSIRPATVGGSQPAAPASDPMQPFIDQANHAMQLGADPTKVQAWLVSQAQGAGLQPQEGDAPPTQGQPQAPAQFGIGTPKQGQQVRTLSDAELKQYNLPAGTVAQMDGNGKISVVNKPGQDSSTVTPPGDPSQTGDAYLQTLPASMRGVVKAIAHGDQAPPSASSRSPAAQALLQAVYTYDPTASASNLPTRTATRKSFTSGKDAQNMTALSQLALHLDHLNGQVDSVSGMAAPDFVNGAINAVTDKSNGKTTAFDSSANAVAHELRAVFANAGGGTEAELEQNLKQLNSSNSLAQKQAAIQNIAQLVHGRFAILQDKYTQGMGKTEDPFQTSYPGAEATILRLAGATHDGQQAQPQQSAQPRAINPQTGHAIVWNGSAWVPE